MRRERFNGDPLKSKKRKAQEEIKLLKSLREKVKLEKGDLLALIVAALTTIGPVVLVILLLYYFISMFFFG